MRVLVTGATGFLGTALVARLVEVGHKVRVLVRRSSDVSDLPVVVERAYGDVTDGASVLAAADDCEVAFHLAALVQAWWPDERAFERVNVGGLENMLQALRATPSLRRLVYTSSFFALGPTDGTVADSSQEHPGRGFCTAYERSKWAADRVARRAAEEEGLDVVVVYPCVIYGPGRISTANLVVKMIADHFQGRLPGLVGSGARLNNFVHVNDVVLGLLAAQHRGVPGRRYILGGENTSMLQLFQAVHRATGKRPPRLRLPLWVVAVLGWVSVVVARMGGPIPIFTHESVRAFNHDWAYSSRQAHQDLDYAPLSLEEGLRDTLTWMRAVGAIKY
ncbi:hypothetical protein CLOM_g912 [Closterium sp. NIES-68]|nr:hypothetical protein CLOM_g912 [Closterium sp. NIES-68]